MITYQEVLNAMENELSEKRRYPRLEFKRSVMYRLKGAGDTRMGQLLNLAGGGVRIRIADDVEPGTPILLEFQVPGMIGSVLSQAVVIWCSEEKTAVGDPMHVVGVRFNKISDKQRNEILSYVSKRLKTLSVLREENEAVSAEEDDNRRIILIVDDDPDIVEVLKDLLSNNYNVISAPDGYVGYEKAKGNKPDLIFLDIMMPGLDGFSTLLMLKNDEDTKAIPVVMLSVVRDKEKIVRATLEGAASYIIKPFDTDTLLEKVARYAPAN
jgi:CheY-like chemotaxis protein